jgi:hypothetical protein
MEIILTVVLIIVVIILFIQLSILGAVERVELSLKKELKDKSKLNK